MGKNVILRAIKSQKLLLSSFKKKKKICFLLFSAQIGQITKCGQRKNFIRSQLLFFFLSLMSAKLRKFKLSFPFPYILSLVPNAVC